MKEKCFFKIIVLIVLLSMILPIGFPSNQTKALADTLANFSDIKKTDWFYGSVITLTKKGLIGGYPNGKFKPNDKIKVDEFIKILVSAIDSNIEPSQSGYWAEGYIKKAKEIGIVKDGEFTNYTRDITRGEMARMIVRAGTSPIAKKKGISLDIPDNYKEYYYLITDYYSLDSDSQDIALKIFTSGILSGFSDGSLGFKQNATRAEACTILLRLLDKSQRITHELPVDFSKTLNVKEFTTQLLKAIGKEATMDFAYQKGYVRPSAEYPSYEKPILKREAALTMARVMNDLTGVTALFTYGDNDYFVTGEMLNFYRVAPGMVQILLQKAGEKYLILTGWENYRGHISDIRMLTPEYQKEMVTLYLAGIIDTNEKGELRPYDFLTKEEAEKWIENVKQYSSLNSQDEVLIELAKNIRNLAQKPMSEVEKPSNASLWRFISPYVNKRLYEYPLKLDKEKYDFANYYNYEMKESTLKNYKQTYKLYFNTRYTVDYRNLNAQAKYYCTYTGRTGMGDYLKRVLFYFNPAHSVNGYTDENGNKRKLEDVIIIDEVLKEEIEEYKKYKVVSQADLIVDESLLYTNFNVLGRATLRIIYYPPTDPAFLKTYGLEVGKWYEKDILIEMSDIIYSNEKFGDRWEYSCINFWHCWDFSPYRLMEYLK